MITFLIQVLGIIKHWVNKHAGHCLLPVPDGKHAREEEQRWLKNT